MKPMKKCPHCGAIQQASRQSCIDCGRVLPSADQGLSGELEAHADAMFARRFAWDFRSPKFVVSFVFMIVSLVSLILDIILIITSGNTHNVSWCAVSVCFAAAALFFGLAPFSDTMMEFLFSPRRGGSTQVFGGLKTVVFLVILFTLISVGLLVYFLLEQPLIGEPGLMFYILPYRRGFGIRLS